MAGTGYFLQEDEIRYLRGLEERIARLEAQALAEMPVGALIDYAPPCRSPKWSESHLAAIGDNWDHYYLLNELGTSLVGDRSEDPLFEGELLANEPDDLPVQGQIGGLATDGGYSVYFAGGLTGSRIELPLLSNQQRGWVMEAVFKPEILPQQSYIFCNGSNAGSYAIGTGDASGGGGSFLALRSQGGTYISTGYALKAGQWYAVSFYSNASDNELHWYAATIDPLTKAFSIASGSKPQVAVTPLGTQAAIGTRSDGASAFKGWVDEVLITDDGASIPTTEVAGSFYDRLRTALEPAPPAGWILADGTELSRSRYARLFSKIGTSEGAGDGTHTFNIPDVGPSRALIRI